MTNEHIELVPDPDNPASSTHRCPKCSGRENTLNQVFHGEFDE